MGTEIFQNVKNPFKKAFKRHHDKLYKTMQSKPVEIGSETYVFVGQMRLQAFPLMSHFDVFDHVGQSATEDVGKDVYTFVSLLMLSRYVRDIQTVLKQQADKPLTDDQLRQTFVFAEEDEARLASTPEQSVELLNSFLHVALEVTAKERWDDSDMEQVKESWNAFWQTYNDRAGALLRLYANNRAPQREGDADHQATHLIWKEASLFAKLSESLTPMNAARDQFSLNDLVAYHYDFGRLRTQDEQLEKIAKMERGLYHFIVLLMRVFIVFALLVVMVLISDDEFEFAVVFPFVFFLIIGSFVKAQNKRRLIAKNNTYVAELRAVSIVEQEESQEQGTTDEVRWAKEHPLYEAVVVSMDLVKVFAVLTAVFMIVTIALLVEGDVDYVAVQYVFYIDVALFLFAVYLPFSRMAKRKVTVTKQAIYIRKEKVSALEAIRIVVKNQGSDVDVFVNYNNNPFKLRVKKDDRVPLKRALKTWCAQNRIAFQDKDATDA